jgi:gamma-glutamyltranspeptidase/glutathione hydrolase
VRYTFFARWGNGFRERASGSKRVFLEKKKQKTFDCLGRAYPEGPKPDGQEFFASFFQKRRPSFPSLAHDRAARDHAAMQKLALALPLLLCCQPAVAADPAPVAAAKGMVVTAQHLASDVGAEILARGGNAVDAAVAVGYALAVVYPEAGNIGGGGFMTIRLADGRSTFLDFREKAPLAATVTMFQDKDGRVVKGRSTETWLAVGVPGSALGLETAREKYGTLPRETLMAPAIKLADEGFVLEPGDLGVFGYVAPVLRQDPATAAIFLHDGQVPQPGDRLVQPELARTLAAISKAGPRAALYDGPIGKEIAAASKAGGGIITAEDFAKYRVRELQPVTCEYRGYHVISAPPPSSGGATLCEMLGILQGYDLRAAGFHSAEEVHFLAEAMRYAYVDRNSELGDPDFVKNPVAKLISPAYDAAIRAKIDPERATPSTKLSAADAGHEGTNTTQYSIVDAAGNAVSVTYTLNEWFGIGKVAGHTGIVMNNEMDDFTSKPGVANMFGLVQGTANAVAPGKTPLSSMTPTIITKDGHLVMVIGSPGGSRITTITLEAVVNVIDHGMNIQEAIDAPRIHEQWQPDTVFLERFALSPDTRALLMKRGYEFTDGNHWGVAEGILAGAPQLHGPQSGSETASLPLGNQVTQGATLFGAHDVRGGAGKASGVDVVVK